MKDEKLVKYLKKYYKFLAEKSFKEELKSFSNQRIRNYLPLYAAINKNYNLIDDPQVLKEVVSYLAMLQNKKSKDQIFLKFMNSYKSEINLEKRKKSLDKETTKKIFKSFDEFKLTTYSLSKECGVNLKIAGQIKNKQKISLGLVKKMQLLRKLERKYENK